MFLFPSFIPVAPFLWRPSPSPTVIHPQVNKSLDNNNESAKYAHSLNKLARKNELSKITMQNAALLKRIQTRQPTYNHLQWEEERRKNEEYLRNISEYPDGLESLRKKKGLSDGNDFDEEGDFYGESTGKRELPGLDPEYSRQAQERAAAGIKGGGGSVGGRKKLPPL